MGIEKIQFEELAEMGVYDEEANAGETQESEEDQGLTAEELGAKREEQEESDGGDLNSGTSEETSEEEEQLDKELQKEEKAEEDEWWFS